MRQLTQNEIEQVNGGILPLVGFAVALVWNLMLSASASLLGLAALLIFATCRHVKNYRKGG